MIRKEIQNIAKIKYEDEYDLWEQVYNIVTKLKYINKEETQFLLVFCDDIDNSRWFELYHDDLSFFLIKLWERYKLID